MQLQPVIYEAPERLFYKCTCGQVNSSALKECAHCQQDLGDISEDTDTDCSPEDLKTYAAYHHDLTMMALVLGPVGSDAVDYQFTEYASHPAIVAATKHFDPDHKNDECPFIRNYHVRDLVFRGVLRFLESDGAEVPDDRLVGPEHYWRCQCDPDATPYCAIQPNSMEPCRHCGTFKRDGQGQPTQDELDHYPRYQRDHLTFRLARVANPTAAHKVLRHPAIEAAYDYLDPDLPVFVADRHVRNLLIAGAFALTEEVEEEHASEDS